MNNEIFISQVIRIYVLLHNQKLNGLFIWPAQNISNRKVANNVHH